MKFLPLVLKNLSRNRRRTILTVFSVAVSLSLLGFLLTIYGAFYVRDRPDEQVLRLVTRHRVSLTQALPEFYGSRIKAVDGVEEVCIQNWFGGMYKDNRPENMFARFAVEPEKIFAVNPEFEASPEQLQAFTKNRQAMAVSPVVYLSPLQSSGQESKCHAEIWFAHHDDVVYVVTPATAWRTRAIQRGLDRARIWVGDHGVWRSSSKFKSAPSYLAKASIVAEGDAAIERGLATMGAKYAGEWGKWGPR